MNKNSGESSGADRISSLPRDLLQKILGCLPLHDAVRTSVLSTKWRYKWVVRSELVFDYNINKEILLKTSIYKVLLMHQGEVRKFSLLVPSSNLFSDIDTWILFLSSKNVQELSLAFLTCCRLPSHLFKFQDLKHLELDSCEFNPPPNFKGFRSLVTLNFQFVTFEPMSFQVLLSSSPLLENVSMVCCSEFDSFIIEAPNLKIFKFSSTANSLCFRRTPLLEEIVLGMPFNMSESFTVPEPQLTLHNIKILNFKNLIFSEVEWVAYVLDLINHSPNIERLLITSYAYTSCACTHPLRSQEMTMTHSAMKRLKSVDMTLMWVNKTEMEFLKHVLAYATALEKIYIATSAEIRHRGMKMMEEMKRFPRASPNVEFIYHS
ncbi:hypothetical protein H5410_042748 [Solanum commersonii]|uniref:F-box domain-containing protein n=1 Tax=Solanum commersonii TaxID=4109 RepID=A0A9J5XWW5_SOLCO|nr:hypothetical protein H5410_042748 [Solanum commersonii]